MPDVVVKAQRGLPLEQPLIGITPDEIESYGVGTLSELLAELRPQTRSSRSASNPIVLINGRLAGPTEFSNIPVEGIERYEILPEVEALKYGFGQDQLVVNVTLREHFRAATAYASDAAATEGGGHDAYTDGSWVQLENNWQASIRGSYRDDAWLRESQRDIESFDSAYRTLLPATTDAVIGANLAGLLWGVSTSVEASFELKHSTSLQGLAAAGDGASPRLELGSNAGTAHVAAHGMGHLGRFEWISTATYNRAQDKSLSNTGLDPAGDLQSQRTRAVYAAEALDLSVSGPLFYLPAGPAVANVKLALAQQRFDTDSALPATPGVATPLERVDLSRVDRTAMFNANVPLTSRTRGVWGVAGELSANLMLGFDNVSDFGTLRSYGAGFAWAPHKSLAVTLAFTDLQVAPTVQQLLAPPIITPNLELFDYVTGDTVYVTAIGGGAPNLLASDNRSAKLALAFGPLPGGARLIGEYEQSHVRNAVGALPPLTAAVQAAFPSRFLRAADGTLIEVDQRWTNLALQRKDDVRWGITVPLIKPKDGGTGPQPYARFAIFDTWYLRATTLIRDGLPPLDELNGAPTDVNGGQPRHRVEVRAGVFAKGWGANLYGTYQTATRVTDATTLNGLSFSALTKVYLRLFADVKPALRLNGSWADRLRVSIGVLNLLDERQTVHDAGGVTPVGFQPGYLDPMGRTITLTARKQF